MCALLRPPVWPLPCGRCRVAAAVWPLPCQDMPELGTYRPTGPGGWGGRGMDAAASASAASSGRVFHLKFEGDVQV